MAKAECARLMSISGIQLLLLRLGKGELALHDEPFNLAPVLRACAAQARYLRVGDPLRENVDIPLIEIRSDLGAMHKLLYALLACLYRLEGATMLRISARSDTHIVTVEMEDDGDALVSVEKLGGLPFELDLCGRAASLLGGSLNWYRESDRNRYSLVFPRSMQWRGDKTISADFPRYAEEAHVHRVSEAGASGLPLAGVISAKVPRQLNGGTILVIDDEPLSLFTVKRRLEAAGWKVDARLSAVDCLGHLDKLAFDLALVNASLPGASGLDFCRALRAREGRESRPVLVVIDSQRPEDIEAAFLAGANDFLVRPVGASELLARVATQADLAAGIKRDLEQRSRMAELDKFKTLGLLAAGVAHEINTPNNAVLRNVPILKELWAELVVPLGRIAREEGDFRIRGFGYDNLVEEFPEMLNDLYMGAQHIRKIVTDLKDYAHGPDPAFRDATDINMVLSYASRLLKHSIALASDHVTFSYGEGLPHVRADRLKLTQVVVNVLENALQALPDRSRAVSVSSSAEPGPGGERPWVCVRIRDEGEGMSESTLASALDPFFTTKRDKGGTGLGLPVAAGIVRELGGTMEIRSSAGKGTEVLVRLPADGTSSGGEGDR